MNIEWWQGKQRHPAECPQQQRSDGNGTGGRRSVEGIGSTGGVGENGALGQVCQPCRMRCVQDASSEH